MIKKKPMLTSYNCTCTFDSECVQGHLIQMNPLERKRWVQNRLKFTLIQCSQNYYEYEINKHNINLILIQLNAAMYYDRSKIIDFHDFFRCNVGSLKNANYLPAVMVLINQKTGKRIFFESEGVCFYAQQNIMGQNILGVDLAEFYILNNSLAQTLNSFKLLLVDSIPVLKKDYESNYNDFVIEFIKVGHSWSSITKRQNLVKKLTRSANILAYNCILYKKEKFVAAQKKCRNMRNTYIDLTIPVSLSYHPNHTTWRVYKSLREASEINVICSNKLVSRIFSNDQKFQYCHLIKNKKLGSLNAQKFDTLNRNIKVRKEIFFDSKKKLLKPPLATIQIFKKAPRCITLIMSFLASVFINTNVYFESAPTYSHYSSPNLSPIAMIQASSPNIFPLAMIQASLLNGFPFAMLQTPGTQTLFPSSNARNAVEFFNQQKKPYNRFALYPIG